MLKQPAIPATAKESATKRGEVKADEAKVTIRLVSWFGGFTFMRQVTTPCQRKLTAHRYKAPVRDDGKLCHWFLQLWEYDAGETEWRPIQYRSLPDVKTKIEVREVLRCEIDKFKAAEVRWRKQLQCTTPPTGDGQRLHEARLKVLKKPYRVTTRLWRQIGSAMRLAEKAGLRSDTDALEHQLVAVWKVETSKLTGRKFDTEDSLPEGIWSDHELAEAVGDAMRHKRQFADRIDYELAANWKDKDYVHKYHKDTAIDVAKATDQECTQRFVWFPSE